MKARRYELTDKEWELVQPLIPISHTGRPQKDKDVTGAARETMRRIVDQLESVENPPESIQTKAAGACAGIALQSAAKSSMAISKSR